MPLGVDIGGTFTDFVLLADGRLTVHKAPTTPRDHAQAFMDGLAHLGGAETAGPIIHGTTVVTNTLLERSGARTALVATQGFKDILTIWPPNPAFPLRTGAAAASCPHPAGALF